MQKLYLYLCKRWGPGRLTFSAYAWKVFITTGSTFWRDRIDGLMLLIRGEHQHCYQQWQRETRAGQ